MVCLNLLMISTVIGLPIKQSVHDDDLKTETLPIDRVVADIILKDLLIQVEQEGKTLQFTFNEKRWVLANLAKYLFESEEQDIVSDVLPSNPFEVEPRDSPVVKIRHDHREKATRKRRRADKSYILEPMDRLSITHEYRVLAKISQLLRREEDNEAQQLLNDMRNLG